MIPLNQGTGELMMQGRRLLKYLPSIYGADEDPRDPLFALLALWHHLYRQLEDSREFASEVVDPRKAHDGPPQDFLSWLAHWVALDPLNEIFFPKPTESERPRLREAVERAVALYTYRGTAKGLRDMAAIFLDETISVAEWVWPRGWTVGLSSTVGIDSLLTDHEDTEGCFVVTVETTAMTAADYTDLHWLQLPLVGRDSGSVFSFFVGQPPTARNSALVMRLRHLRRLLDLEKPAHTDCFIALDYIPLEEPPITGPDRLIVGVNSTIGGFWMEDAPLLMVVGVSSIIGMCATESAGCG
jgi:phage tail-like protein